AMSAQQVMVGRGQLVLKSDVDLTITGYHIAPVWAGTTTIAFEGSVHTDPATTTFFYRIAQAAELAMLGQQIHGETISIIHDEQDVTGIIPTEPSRAYFYPTELLSSGEG